MLLPVIEIRVDPVMARLTLSIQDRAVLSKEIVCVRLESNGWDVITMVDEDSMTAIERHCMEESDIHEVDSDAENDILTRFDTEKWE